MWVLTEVNKPAHSLSTFALGVVRRTWRAQARYVKEMNCYIFSTSLAKIAKYESEELLSSKVVTSSSSLPSKWNQTMPKKLSNFIFYYFLVLCLHWIQLSVHIMLSGIDPATCHSALFTDSNTRNCVLFPWLRRLVRMAFTGIRLMCFTIVSLTFRLIKLSDVECNPCPPSSIKTKTLVYITSTYT